MSLRRLATVFLLSGLAVVVTATPAAAHAELIGSDPAKGATLAAPPQQVELTFNQPVTLGAKPVTVTGPDGTSWTVGTPSVAGPVVTAPVTASGPAGTYNLVYEVVSQDGDEVTGAVTFTVTAVANPPATTTTTTATTTEAPAATTSAAPAAARSTDDDGGLPGWVWVLGAVVALAVGVAVALRLGRAGRA
ncbi:copper resistance CopC family protein [Actinophytocola glycyrrhizae]|uniref:Copper resistance protein CopC n=1 Tax=Actinophytocola glycyrrhizae TaxID=2044873 RepID=A0ABV9RUY9_9PSEU